MDTTIVAALIIGLALLFDFLNGMNDAANSIATIVATRVLTPRVAVAWAAFFNFAAVFIFGTAVAKTVGKGIVTHDVVNNTMVVSSLFGAIIWTWLCTRFGLPISVSHSLIGGMIGSAIACKGVDGVIWWPGMGKVAVFIFLAPILGLLLGASLMMLSLLFSHRQPPQRVDRIFRSLQLFSAAFYSLGHGSNDAQKVAGLITAMLVANHYLPADSTVPTWVLIMCYSAIALGTWTGGWRVVRTLGVRVTKLQPIGGSSAETAAGLTLVFTAVSGIPVSTTHTITGAVMGVGATRRLSAVRWAVAGHIIAAWVTTIPACALMSALALYCLRFVGGLVCW